MNTDFNATSSPTPAASHYSEASPQDARPKQQSQVFGRYACLNSDCDRTFKKWKMTLDHMQQEHDSEEALSKTVRKLSMADKDSSDELSNPKVHSKRLTSRKGVVAILNDMSLSESKATWLSGGKKEKINIAFNHYLLCPQTGCHMITAATPKYYNHMIKVHGNTDKTVDYGQGALEANAYLRQQPWAEVDETITSEMIAKAVEDRRAVREGCEARADHKGRKTARNRFVDNS